MLKPLFVTLALVALCACVAKPVEPINPTTDPTTDTAIDSVVDKPIASQSECVSAGGHWGRACMAQQAFCFIPSRDAGKGCNDNSECESRCLEAKDGQKQAGFAGVCQADNNPCGCFSTISKGQLGGTLCID